MISLRRLYKDRTNNEVLLTSFLARRVIRVKEDVCFSFTAFLLVVLESLLVDAAWPS